MASEFVRIFERHARFRPNKIALIDRQALTFAQMWSISGLLAGKLRKTGLEAGHCLGVAFTPSADYVILILGMLRAGLVVAPLNTRLTAPELTDYLTRLRPGAVITDDTYLELIENIGLPCVRANPADDKWSVEGTLPSKIVPSETMTGAAFVIGTGGSTGVPKGALFSHSATWMWVACTAFAQQLRENDIEVFGSPFFHSTLLTGLMTPLAAGASVRLVRRFDAESVIEAVVRDGATRLGGAPTMLHRVVEHAADYPEAWRRVRLVQFGSTTAPPGFVERLRSALPHADLITGFGTTEFGPATRKYTPEIVGPTKTGVGRPLPTADVVIVDPESLRVIRDYGVDGEIAVSNPWQMSRYVGAEDETRLALLPSKHIRSGDIGRFDADGFLHFQGRYKEIIVTGGENVFPIEVERVIGDHPAVTNAAVYGVNDEVWGERVEVAIVLAPGTSIDIEELRGFCSSRLASYKIPRNLAIYEELPLTANLKVDKLRLSGASHPQAR